MSLDGNPNFNLNKQWRKQSTGIFPTKIGGKELFPANIKIIMNFNIKIVKFISEKIMIGVSKDRFFIPFLIVTLFLVIIIEGL
jgi:hypothetical protein